MDYEYRFSTFDACELLGVEYMRLNEWIRKGYIDIDTTAQGRGTRARLCLDDLVTVRAMQLMVASGITRQLAAELIRKAKASIKDADMATTTT